MKTMITESKLALFTVGEGAVFDMVKIENDDKPEEFVFGCYPLGLTDTGFVACRKISGEKECKKLLEDIARFLVDEKQWLYRF